jgi:hypothetical protein
MQLRTHDYHLYPPFSVMPCAQCATALFAPAWSERLDDRRIRHLWTCRACGYRFETLVCYPVANADLAA